MYPVIPWQLRTVMNHCVIEEYEVPAKTRVLICQTATHYMDDVFKDPLKFDISRYQRGRQEHLTPCAYRSLWLGYTCLSRTSLGRFTDDGQPPAHRLSRKTGIKTRKLQARHPPLPHIGTEQEDEVQSCRSQKSRESSLKTTSESHRGQVDLCKKYCLARKVMISEHASLENPRL